MSARRLVAAALAALLLAAPASAHLVQTGFGAFYDGLAHLVLTPADLLSVLGLGLLAGLCGKETARATMFPLALAWLAGCLVGASFPAGGELAAPCALSVVLCGLLVALRAPLARRAAGALALAVGLLHGYADGATIRPPDALTLAGASLCAFVLVTLTAAFVVELREGAARLAVRVAGSWIAAVGLLMLGWELRGTP